MKRRRGGLARTVCVMREFDIFPDDDDNDGATSAAYHAISRDATALSVCEQEREGLPQCS